MRKQHKYQENSDLVKLPSLEMVIGHTGGLFSALVQSSHHSWIRVGKNYEREPDSTHILGCESVQD